MTGRPPLFIFTGVSEPTGALFAAYREALALADLADVTLVVATGAKIDRSKFPSVRFAELPLARTTRRISSLAAYPFALLRAGHRLRQAMANAGCARLQVNDFYFLEGAVAKLLGFSGKTVTWVRMDPAMLGGFGKLCLKIARRSSAEVVAVSHHIHNLLPTEMKATVLYDPVPEVPMPAAHLRSQRLTFIGNFNANKGQDIAIRAFDMIADEFPKAELHFYGSDLGLPRNRKYLAQLRKEARMSRGCERIHFHGFTTDVPAVLADSLVALNLSRSESFSLTCQEASLYGAPIIATRSGGPAEIISDNETGYLVDVDDYAAVANCLRTFLADPHQAAAMGQAGAALVRKRFAPAPFQARLSELFELA